MGLRGVFCLFATVLAYPVYADPNCATTGTYVSKDTCTPALQCGTVQKPFCEITSALPTGEEIKVAVSRIAYTGSLILTNHRLIGGYNSNFSSVVGRSQLDGYISGSGAGAIQIENLSVDPKIPRDGDTVGNLNPHHRVMDFSGTASVKIKNVVVNGLNRTVTNAKLFAVKDSALYSTNTGNLQILNSELHSLLAEKESSALFISASPMQVSISDSKIVSGRSVRTIAVRAAGAGELALSRAKLNTLFGVTTAGIRAVSGSARALKIIVNESEIAGGPADHYVPPTFGDRTPSHYGISGYDIHLEVRGSEIIAAPNGDAVEAKAVDVMGAHAASLVVENNKKILGGYVGSKWSHGFNFAAGIQALGNVEAVIKNNDWIQGCHEYCDGVSIGVYLFAFVSSYEPEARDRWEDFQNIPAPLLSHPAWKILDNNKVVGGPGRSAYYHVGVKALSATPMHYNDPQPTPSTLEVRGNKRIEGAPEGSEEIYTAVGLWVEGTNAKIKDNRIVAGPAIRDDSTTLPSRSAGLRLRGGYEKNIVTAEVSDNLIEGGSGRAWGADSANYINRFERNFISNAFVGLSFQSDRDSKYFNNIVIGQTSACLIGCSERNSFSPDTCYPHKQFDFINNLCFNPYEGGNAATQGSRSPSSRVANNIFDAHHPAYGTNASGLTNNVMVPRFSDNCSYWEYRSFRCLKPAAQDVGLNNVTVDPNYQGPLREPYSIEKFSPKTPCALKGLGLAIDFVSHDILGRPRATVPAVGPFECN